MMRLLKLSALTLLIVFGAWLGFSGVFSIWKTRVDGVYVTTTENCFFIPDIGGWLGQVWRVGVAVVGLFLGWMGAKSLFAAMRLDEPCACKGGHVYRHCCFRRERGVLFVGVLAVLALLVLRALEGSVISMLGILLSAALACCVVWHFYRRPST